MIYASHFIQWHQCVKVVDKGVADHPLLHSQYRPVPRYKVEEQHCPRKILKQFVSLHHASQHGLYYYDDADDV